MHEESNARVNAQPIGASTAPRIELHWTGKHKPERADPVDLRRVECVGESATELGPRWLVRGDNRVVMATLAAEPARASIHAAGGIQLVYLDPPFGTGDTFALHDRPGADRRTAYRDTWGGPVAHVQWLYERAILARDLLAADGALYLHVDWRTSAWAKCVLDEVFGPDRFRGWIAWHLRTGAKSRARWSQQHQDILCYAKGDQFAFDPRAAELREPFSDSSRATHFKHVDADGRKHRVRRVNGKDYVYFDDEGRLVGSVWTDCPSMLANTPLLPESLGYPTQKPEKLLARILAASSKPGDLVADFACGSGTTAAVAERMGRRWIACDAGALAIATTRRRLIAMKLPDGANVSFERFDARTEEERASDAPPIVDACIERSVHGTIVRLAGIGDARDSRVAERVDAWSVELDGRALWHGLRTRRGEELPIASAPIACEPLGELRVRVIDALGQETIVTPRSVDRI